jgi:hypothetical protein
VSDVSDDPDGIFACRVQCPLSTKHPEFALSVAVAQIRVESCGREKPLRGGVHSSCYSSISYDIPVVQVDTEWVHVY